MEWAWVIVVVAWAWVVGVAGTSAWFIWHRPMLPPVDTTPLAMRMVEENAKLNERMIERGLDSIITALERATYGPTIPEEVVGTAQTPAVVSPDAPVWANWPVDGVVTEGTDAAYPDIVGWDNAERAASVTHLPNFPDMTGEELA